MELKNFDKYTAISREHIPYLRDLAAAVSQSPYRPVVHICPPCGLLNDPNGLCWYEGWYHVFYQWYPFGASHGMKHWAHVKSRDLSAWEWCDEILIPSQPYEKNGCYSGNAFVSPEDGNCYLFYTANYKTEKGRIPKQAAAIMKPDGTISKCSRNPLIDGAPSGMGGDIRDPFVFEQNGRYYMMLGATDQKGKGQLILYSGSTLLEWDYLGIVRITEKGKELNLGTMVECPGFIKADGYDVLMISLIGLPPQGDRYLNQFTSLALTGRLDLEHMEFRAERTQETDCGFDFYAPQPFYGKNKTPMVFGWLGCGEQKLPEDRYHWRHGLTLPRLLQVRQGQLYTPPCPEVLPAFGTPIQVPPHPTPYSNPKIPVCLNWSFEDDGLPHVLQVGSSEDFWSLTVDMSQRSITWDRSSLKIPVDPAYGSLRRCTFATCSPMELLICLDNTFVEIYANNGERVLSGRTYEAGSDKIPAI